MKIEPNLTVKLVTCRSMSVGDSFVAPDNTKDTVIRINAMFMDKVFVGGICPRDRSKYRIWRVS